jgi:hypothetical protein
LERAGRCSISKHELSRAGCDGSGEAWRFLRVLTL